MVGKTWQQATEEASHSVSTARGSGNKSWSSACILLLEWSRTLRMRDDAPAFRMSLPTQPSLSGNTLLDTPRVFPWGLEILSSCQDDQPPYNSSQSVSYYPHPCSSIKISFFLGLSICTLSFEHRMSPLNRKLCNGVMAFSIVQTHIMLIPDIHGLSLKFQRVLSLPYVRSSLAWGRKIVSY